VLPSFIHCKVREMIALGLVKLGFLLVGFHFFALGTVKNLEMVEIVAALV
jgi:hypothetical protein